MSYSSVELQDCLIKTDDTVKRQKNKNRERIKKEENKKCH